MDKVWELGVVSGLKTEEAQLMSVPVKVNVENGSQRDMVDG